MLGAEHSSADSEIIAMAYQVLRKMNLSSTIKLEINSLGDDASRNHYRKVLIDYFSRYRKDLSEDSVKRLNRGSVLRILDSKESRDQEIVNDAPLFSDFLNKECTRRFLNVSKELDNLGIAYHINPRLVRGLDYYCHTVFEFIGEASDTLGSQQATLLAGGRYDGLLSEMSGGTQNIPSIGWAAGIERLSLLIPDSSMDSLPKPIAMIAVRSRDDYQMDPATQHCLRLCQRLREQGIPLIYHYDGNTTKQLKKLSKNASGAIIVGEEEIQLGLVTFRDLESGKQQSIGENQLDSHCRAFLSSKGQQKSNQ